MEIKLCEDNGFLNDGKPTLVVLVITKDDGKQFRLPYKATKTIQALYQDVAKVCGSVEHRSLDSIVDDLNKPLSEPMTRRISNNQIERNDIVIVTVLEKDIDGNVNEDLEVGHEYRIIDIHKQDKRIIYYEVLDDAKGDKIRIPVRPGEIELVRKFIPGPPRKQVFEIIKRCKCQEDVSLELNGDRYAGQCPKCGVTLTEQRKTANV